jgi:sigma-E factor negative regulatory protein RseC
MSSKISHAGVVTHIDEQGVQVRMERVAACAACNAKKICMAADMEEKIIGVPHSREYFDVGEEVNVVMRQSMGLKAVAYGYILPLIVLLAVLLTLTTLGAAELYAGLGALSALFIYYIILFFLRNRIEKEMSFSLEKLKS